MAEHPKYRDRFSTNLPRQLAIKALKLLDTIGMKPSDWLRSLILREVSEHEKRPRKDPA